jgi:hypothetical protein
MVFKSVFPTVFKRCSHSVKLLSMGNRVSSFSWKASTMTMSLAVPLYRALDRSQHVHLERALVLFPDF